MDLQYAIRALLGERGWRIDRYTDDPFKWVALAVAHGWAYQGERTGRAEDGEAFGTSARGLAPPSFIVAKDDHDQIGNTLHGQRLGLRVTLGGARGGRFMPAGNRRRPHPTRG